MVTAHETSHLAAQPPKGIGARLLRRFGGAVRNAITGGLALAGALRRPAASQSAIGHAVGRNADACPASGQAPRARRSHADSPVAAVQSVQRNGVTQLPGRNHTPPAPVSRTLFPSDRNARFTPKTVPGLGPELCAALNTPLENLDPAILRVLLASFAQAMAQSMPSESGMVDAQELYAALWGRLATVLDEASPDASRADAPMTSMEALPDAPVAPPDPLTQASPFAPPDSLPNVPLVSPAPSPEAEAAVLPHHVEIATVAPPNIPETVALPGPAAQRRRPISARTSFRISILSVFRRCVRLSPGFISLVRCGSLQTPPPRHWFYAARASPA